MGLPSPLHSLSPVVILLPRTARRGLQNFSAKGDSRGKSFLRIIPSPRTDWNKLLPAAARSDSANVTRAGMLFLYSSRGRKTRGLNSYRRENKKGFSGQVQPSDADT